MTIIRKNDDTGETMFKYYETTTISPAKKVVKNRYVVIILHNDGFFLGVKTFQKKSDAMKYSIKKIVKMQADMDIKTTPEKVSKVLTEHMQYISGAGEWILYITREGEPEK